MKDRNVEFPNRFRMTKVEGTDDIYDLIPAPGEVISPGDTFSKANMLPDSIPAALGLKMSNPQVKDALNVLANIGNLHVWERVRILSEPIYKPEESSTNTSITLEPGDILYYSSGVDVVGLEESDISLSEPVSSFSYNGSNFPDVVGKYIRQDGSDLVYYYPTSDQNIAGTTLYLRGCKKISATIDTPAGTTTDYLTSTDRDAYPDQSAEGGQDASYVLGDVVSGNIINAAGSVSVGFYYSDTISVDSEGNIIIPTTNTISLYGYKTTNTDTIKGKFIKLYTSNGDIVPFSGVIYIPSDSVFSINSGLYCSAYQPVTGHAAIPANTTITYLGQLGGGARIEVGSYVGTGTESADIFVGFTPKAVIVSRSAHLGGTVEYSAFILPGLPNEATVKRAEIIDGGFRVYYYSSNQVSYSSYLNSSGVTCRYIAIG